MKVIREETIFDAKVHFNVITQREFVNFITNDTTPNVLNQEYWRAVNTGAVTVTNFANGSEGQELRILGDGFTTVANGTSIKTNTGANKLLATNRMYRFIMFNRVWYEE